MTMKFCQGCVHHPVGSRRDITPAGSALPIRVEIATRRHESPYPYLSSAS